MLLDNFPHTATATRRKRETDAFIGNKDSFPETVFTGRVCWQQPAGNSEITEFQKLGFSVTDKVYFRQISGLDERDILAITNANTGQTNSYEVRRVSDPDATAGLGVVYKVFCERTTTGSAGQGTA